MPKLTSGRLESKAETLRQHLAVRSENLPNAHAGPPPFPDNGVIGEVHLPSASIRRHRADRRGEARAKYTGDRALGHSVVVIKDRKLARTKRQESVQRIGHRLGDAHRRCADQPRDLRIAGLDNDRLANHWRATRRASKSLYTSSLRLPNTRAKSTRRWLSDGVSVRIRGVVQLGLRPMPCSGTNLTHLSVVPDGAAVQQPRRIPDPSAAQGRIARAVDGDLEAWGRLYHDHFDSVLTHVCYLVGDVVLAEDLVQDIFARAMTHIQTFDQRSSFLSWIRGIAINVVRMHWRRADTTARVHRDFEAMSRLAEAAALPDQAHAQEQRMQMLYQVLQTVPTSLREAFILRELEGIPAAEAAAQLGITTGNLAVRLTRARSRIRRELTRRGWLGGGP